MATSTYPREDIPQKDKNEDWMKKHLSYAESVLVYNNDLRDRMNRWFDGYNGIKPPKSIEWLEKSYGQQNKSRYISYRLGRTKIDLLQGEWLKRPLQATVTTINREAMSEKMRNYDTMMGAQIAKEEITEIKDKAGVDIMEGAPIPSGDDDPIWQKMSFKDKCEDVMQIILDNQVKDLDVKRKLGQAFINVEISARCYWKTERNETGDIEVHNIDPRDGIYEEIEGDDYLEKSPIMGCRQALSVHEILKRYTLTKDQRDLLNNARGNPEAYTGINGIGRGYMNIVGGELLCDVIHIEWKSVTPEYYKIVPKTASQLMLDPSEDTLTFQLDVDKYEANIEMHNKNVEAGLYVIETKYKEEEYEATRIGGVIDVNMRRTFFQKRGVDNPGYILSSSYYGYIHGRVSGVSVPLQQIIENFDNIYDICMYQILKEFARMKGRILTIDRAGLGKGQKLEDVAYRMLNDQLLDYDSAEASRVGTRNVDLANMFKQFDLGLSDSFQYLLQMKQDIRNELNQITGINENRMGQTAASSTATAQQSDISNSRTITESLFYGFSGFVQRVMLGIVQSSAVSWAFYKLEKGEQILGSEKFKFLQVTQDIGYRDYGVYIEDGSRYLEVSQKIEQMMQVSLNAKEIRPMDALNVLLAETVSQKRAFLENSWAEMQKIMQASQESGQQSAEMMNQQKMQTQIEIANADREDRQEFRLVEIDAEADAEIRVNQSVTKNDIVKQNFKSSSEAINNQEIQ